MSKQKRMTTNEMRQSIAANAIRAYFNTIFLHFYLMLLQLAVIPFAIVYLSTKQFAFCLGYFCFLHFAIALSRTIIRLVFFASHANKS